MTLTRLAVLLVAVALAATGQLLLKHGMTVATESSKETGRSLVRAAVTSPWVIGGLVVFAVSAVFWLITLSTVPLSVAYPFNAIGYLVILGASVLVLHERASIWTVVGTCLVVGGLIVVVSTAPGTS